MSKSQRYHGLDFARAVLMLLGVFYHTALIYKPNSTWDATHETTSLLFAYLTSFTSSFRMHAFYVIAGFFLMLLFHKKGISYGIKERFVRLFIPMIFIGFTLNFIANFLSETYTYPESFFSYVYKGEWLRHTWFLGNLICYCFIGMVLIKFNIIRYIEKHLSTSRYFLLLAILITPIAVVAMKDQAWRITDYSSYFFISPRILLIYMPYFVIGLISYEFKTLIFSVMSYRSATGLTLLACCLKLTNSTAPIDHYLIQATLTEYTSFFLCFAMIILLCRIGESGSHFSKRLAEASYTIYLLHTPLILCIYVLFFKSNTLNIFIQYISICTAVIVFSYYFHELVVRRNEYFSFLINGKK